MSYLWLLTHLNHSRSSTLIKEAAERRGHRIELIAPVEISLAISEADSHRAVIRSEGTLPLPDAVLTRLGSSSPLAGLHVLRELELRGVPCSNSSYGLERSRDKVRCFQELRAAHIPIPRTIALGSHSALDTVLAELRGPPWILKLPISTQGKGVMFVDSVTSLRSIVDAFHSVRESLLVQEFVAESSGVDIRVLVVNGKARAAMKRQAQAGEFRSNLHRGGCPTHVELDSELQVIAERAAQVLRLDVAGVDLLQTNSGYCVIEVNGSPGLEGLQSVTPFSLSETIVEMIESRCTQS